MREVSERREAEKALRAKLAEAERTVTALRATVADLEARVHAADDVRAGLV